MLRRRAGWSRDESIDPHRRPTMVVLVGIPVGAAAASSFRGSSAQRNVDTRRDPEQEEPLQDVGLRKLSHPQGGGCEGDDRADLNRMKPSKARVIRVVTNGRGAMPSFKGVLNKARSRRSPPTSRTTRELRLRVILTSSFAVLSAVTASVGVAVASPSASGKGPSSAVSLGAPALRALVRRPPRISSWSRIA